ncbi:MAG: class I SAM-dependent methyltransferase [Pseudomonadales bacterium]|nr:class I SAM-dependent methyltransferase [Pseudomonadales bacterium]
MANNEEQSAYWNGQMGDAWVSVETYIDRMLSPLSDVAVKAADAKSGTKILDVGCGCGPTTLKLADLGAEVLGVDISQKMIDRANEHAGERSGVSFKVADAASEHYNGDYDIVFSRFGVMFFDDPVAAFNNLRSALKPGGRLNVLVWQAPVKNPWMSLPARAIEPYQPDAPASDPKDPGPFAMADRDHTRDILTQAGFTDIEFVDVEKSINLGKDVDEVMDFQTYVGPLSRLLEVVDEATGMLAIQAVREEFGAQQTNDGINLPASALLVKASA